MTITINKNVLIFVVALIGLGIAGYVIGAQMSKPSAETVATATQAPAANVIEPGATLQLTSPTAVADNAPRIAMDEFKASFDQGADMIIVDVRTPDQYAAGHIAGAINIPEAEVQAHLTELPKDKHIVLYCA